MRCRLREERGSNAVEFALVLPLLVALLLGMLWGGLALNTRMTATQVARETARYGATIAYTTPMSTYFAQVEDRLLNSTDGMNVGNVRACIRAYDGATLQGTPHTVNGFPGCSSSSTIATGTTADISRVEVEISTPARFDYYFGGGTMTLTSQAIARHEGGS